MCVFIVFCCHAHFIPEKRYQRIQLNVETTFITMNNILLKMLSSEVMASFARRNYHQPHLIPKIRCTNGFSATCLRHLYSQFLLKMLRSQVMASFTNRVLFSLFCHRMQLHPQQDVLTDSAQHVQQIFKRQFFINISSYSCLRRSESYILLFMCISAI